MKSRKSEIHSIPSSFKSYKINYPDYKSIKTLELVLHAVFSIPSANNTNDAATITSGEEVNEIFLINLAHGIQTIDKYDPGITPNEVMYIVKQLSLKFPERKDACDFFLNHYQTITQFHGPHKIEIHSHRNKEWLSPRTLENPVSFCLADNSESTIHSNLKKNKQIDAMVNDIRILHLNNFMNLLYNFIDLGKPIPEEENNITSSFNQLLKIISDDIKSSKEDHKQLRKKIKTYLVVAKKLLSGPIMNLEGGAIVTYALEGNTDLLNTLKDNDHLKSELNKLTDLFTMLRNFLVLREKMPTPNCIPLFMVINKDIQFCKENKFWDKIFLLGQQYAYLAQKRHELEAETKRLRIFHPSYQTNLCDLITLNNITITPSEEKQPLLVTRSTALTRKPKQRHSLSVTSPTPTLINSTSTPSLVRVDGDIENKSQKRKLKKIETKSWNRESLNIKLSEIKPEKPEIKTERIINIPETINTNGLQQHSYFASARRSDSRRYSDSSAPMSNRSHEKSQTVNNSEEKIENSSITYNKNG